ncbi:30S ribosomal protein S20 [Planctomycetes bacterium Pan216]|uniref:Small ribosomal subunit protein bS20 n=1 Tax=Kolteria novifilia TaxID=2527975 RepID=A0A518AX48_9BACT|nr:30S ribosomal protein S20 [Planctomycetes bacterium Pan216]
MPHTKSAKKRLVQSFARRERNRHVKSDLRTQIKHFLKAIKEENLDEARTNLRLVYKKLDKCAVRRYLHPNTACRYKSRLTKRVNALAQTKMGA